MSYFTKFLTFYSSSGNLSSVKKEGTLAFSPENPITRKATTKAMEAVAKDNLGFLSLLFDASALPPPKGFANAKELEIGLTQPNVMRTILLGIQYEDDLASE